MDFSSLIQTLIDNKTENDYVDFKETWHTNKARLLHDIICLANNRVDKDAYLIIGIRDKTFDIIGVEEDNNRKNQQNLIDFLNQIPFAGGIRPNVEVKTIIISNHELDIIIVKNSTDTPYFLLENYPIKKNEKPIVRKYAIYTRARDTNTPINKCADIDQIEYLWKKRFLLHKSQIIRFFEALKNKNDWEESLDDSTNETIFYNKYNPEYKVILNNEEYSFRKEFYFYLQTNSTPHFKHLTLKYFETKIYDCTIALLDGYRYLTPTPDWSFIDEISNLRSIEGKIQFHGAYKYFIIDSNISIIQKFLYDDSMKEAVFAKKKFDDVILYFNNDEERKNFEIFVKENKENINLEIDEEFKKLKYNKGYLKSECNEDEREFEYIIIHIATGIVLKKWQEKYNTEKN